MFSNFPSDRRQSSLLTRTAYVGLWLFVFCIPWEDTLVFEGLGTGARLAGILAFSFGLVAMLARGYVRRLSVGHLLLFLFTLWAALTYLWTVGPELTLTRILTNVQLLAMTWLIWEFASSESAQLGLLQAYVLGTYVSIYSTIIQYLGYGATSAAKQPAYQRYAAAGFNENDLGLIVALSIPFSFYLARRSHGKIIWVYRLQLLLAGITVLLTASRTALLGAVLGYCLVALRLPNLTFRKVAIGALGATVSASVLVTFVPSTSWQRISTIPKEVTQGNLNLRTVVWKAGWEVFRESPFRGIGAGAFPEGVEPILGYPVPGRGYVAHNSFISISAETGVVGLGLFIAALLILAICVLDLPSGPKRLWAVMLFVWALGVSTATWEHKKPTWLLFGLILAQWDVLANMPARLAHWKRINSLELPERRARCRQTV